MSSNLSRRSVLKGILAGTVAMGIPARFSDFGLSTNEDESTLDLLKGNINHSVGVLTILTWILFAMKQKKLESKQLI